MSENHENIALVETFWQFFAVNDFDSALAMWTNDAVWWINGTTPMSGWTTKAQFVEWGKGAIPAMFPDGLKMTMNKVWATENMVIAESTSVATHASGNEYRGQYAHFFEIKDGKIASVKEYADSHLAMVMLTEWM